MANTPARLKRDAIVEALCEIRFESEDSGSVPEIVVGKLASTEPWSKFQRIRLPINNIPAELRAMDPSLAFQPWLEFKDPNEPRLVRVGPSVFSYHRLEPYCGWDKFKPELNIAIDKLFSELRGFRIIRMGCRYLNMFTKRDHGVAAVTSLNCSAAVNGEPLRGPLNINYRRNPSDTHISQVQIASRDFVQGPMSHKIDAWVDIDVFSPEGWVAKQADEAKVWLEQAHGYEKDEFFNLFTAEMHRDLVEGQ